jgi:hypothetical protein
MGKNYGKKGKNSFLPGNYGKNRVERVKTQFFT